jgi:hypothetical protein
LPAPNRSASAQPGRWAHVMADPFNRTNRDLIISLLVRYGIPAIYDDRPYADLGGLITYGADRSEEFRKAAGYIDRILKGQKPMDLPIQNPNLEVRVRQSLGVTVDETDVPMLRQHGGDGDQAEWRRRILRADEFAGFWTVPEDTLTLVR